ncbi:MAG: pantoate--beta-alanine ligase [Candidatus Aegiribacteria sp.]|nr:pantoate--beta-alanine ligase [Candidatus Aegiribacteria sp.]
MNCVSVLKTANQVGKLVCEWRKAGMTIGFVPTMGALHKGHLSLVSLALEKADRVIVSIFVNPSQFGPGEDLESYPRTFNEDLMKLEEAGAHCVFFPSVEEIYPDGFSTFIHISGLTETLCGKYRPEHFDGVATVCAVLFGIVRPDIAVFGKKDAQQLAVIKKMVNDLRMEVDIFGGDIFREPDGLAMSSRNSYLIPEERKQAAAIFKGLSRAVELVSEGEKNVERICNAVRKIVYREAPLAEIQYLEVVDSGTMEVLCDLTIPGLLAIAVYFTHTRLIDNVILNP